MRAAIVDIVSAFPKVSTRSDHSQAEKQRVNVRETLLMALKTRIINYRRIKEVELANDDLKEAYRLLAANPQLAHHAQEFRELEEN